MPTSTRKWVIWGLLQANYDVPGRAPKARMQQRELASALNWDEATVGLVRRLRRARPVWKGGRPRSKRGLEIYFLTPTGEALYQQAEPRVAQIQRNVLSKIAESDEQKKLLRLLSKMMGENNAHFQPRRKEAVETVNSAALIRINDGSSKA